MEEVLGLSLHDLKSYHFVEPSYQGEVLLLSRTGYTGKMGLSFYPTSWRKRSGMNFSPGRKIRGKAHWLGPVTVCV